MISPMTNPAGYISDDELISFKQNELRKKVAEIKIQSLLDGMEQSFKSEDYFGDPLKNAVSGLLVLGENEKALAVLRQINQWINLPFGDPRQPWRQQIYETQGEDIVEGFKDSVWYGLVIELTPYAAACEAWDCYAELVQNSLVSSDTRCISQTMAGRVCLVNDRLDKALELFEKAKEIAVEHRHTISVDGIDRLIETTKGKRRN